MTNYGSAAPFGQDEGYGGFSESFSEKSVRLAFIRKVYSILCLQLAVTAGIIGIFTMQSVKEYAHQHQEMWWIALVMLFVALIALACCPDVRRKTPHNFIFLGMFTLAEGFMLGCVVSTYDVDEVLMAVGICAAVVFALTLFAFQSKFDFTAWGGALIAILMIFILFGFICIFLPKTRILYLVYASIGAVIFSLYIVYDTQIMLGGKHKYALSPEEYVFAALNLYLDIINLFLYILQIIGLSRNSN